MGTIPEVEAVLLQASQDALLVAPDGVLTELQYCADELDVWGEPSIIQIQADKRNPYLWEYCISQNGKERFFIRVQNCTVSQYRICTSTSTYNDAQNFVHAMQHAKITHVERPQASLAA
jgi:hypothetical protein